MTTCHNTDNVPRETLWGNSRRIWMLSHQELSHPIFRYMSHRTTQDLGCDVCFVYIKYRQFKTFRVGLTLASTLLREDTGAEMNYFGIVSPSAGHPLRNLYFSVHLHPRQMFYPHFELGWMEGML